MKRTLTHSNNPLYKRKEQVVRDYTHYLLINACAMRSPGLYKGKAGIALTVFEVANWLEDKKLGNIAGQILSECLTSKEEDLSFEKGKAGYALKTPGSSQETLARAVSFLKDRGYSNEFVNVFFEKKNGEWRRTTLEEYQERDHTYLKKYNQGIFNNSMQQWDTYVYR